MTAEAFLPSHDALWLLDFRRACFCIDTFAGFDYLSPTLVGVVEKERLQY